MIVIFRASHLYELHREELSKRCVTILLTKDIRGNKDINVGM